MRSRVIGLALLSLCACEDGPTQIFEPNTGNPPQQNGYGARAPFVAPGTKTYDSTSTGDATGRAQFCDEDEISSLIQQLVVQPIIPNVGMGGLPLWDTTTGEPLLADTLVGKPDTFTAVPTNGKFCDPWEEYLNAFTYGPTQEIILFFNEETRLVEGMGATDQYLGTLEGEYTVPGSSPAEKRRIVFENREYAIIDKGAPTEKKLDVYTSRAEQAGKPNAWLNHENINLMYRMIRETYFHADPTLIPAYPTFDCLADKLCQIFYDSPDESVAQQTTLAFWNSGVFVVFYPNGKLAWLETDPVRIANFEADGFVDFDPNTVRNLAGGEMRFKYTSESLGGCNFGLDENLSFADFKTRCIDTPLALGRANYTVATQRDAVDVEFNGITLSFQRQTSTQPVLKDGEHPNDTDRLYEVYVSQLLFSQVDEFVPQDIAVLYASKLEAKLQAAVTAGCPGAHPFCALDIKVPGVDVGTDGSLAADSRQMDKIVWTTSASVEKNWVQEVFATVRSEYQLLTPAQMAGIDPLVTDPVFMIEPFMLAVLEVFSHGGSALGNAHTVFVANDDRRWVFAWTSFKRPSDAANWRLEVHYNMNDGALREFIVGRGYSELDTVFANLVADINNDKGTTYDYYELWMSDQPGVAGYVNPFALNGQGVVVGAFDRQLDTFEVGIATRAPGVADGMLSLTVPGEAMQDLAGYYRPVGGERFEFVPADIVNLFGKETSLSVAVEADGKIGRVSQGSFKGPLELCDGLFIRGGDQVRAKVDAWRDTVTLEQFNNCDVVFNYSVNGNVLNSVMALNKRVSITVMDGRAVSAAIWR
ncbi:MAG: hypothetical protein HY903_15730 [Deltaproteobacteria bacterium]|nr:hypothetical protein [Deltaproteobacteria bacterium]